MKWTVLLLGMVTMSAFAQEEITIRVPNDPNAKHVLVHKSGKPTHRVIITKRIGLTGELYTKRSYNCEKRTVRMIGAGHTLEILEKQIDDWPENAVISRSVAEDIGMLACSEV
ncbi:hypothetical protein [Pseudomonas syringae]|uniref:hypothetical protein n=1 Tax=Pseudomonas syringae TaxID=317 RepID=UPI00067D5E76|nr:hypothetical protein [Pseudomonas syringae]